MPTWHGYDSIYWHFWEEEKLRLHDMWSGRMMIGARSNRKKSGSPAGLMTGSSQLRSSCPAVGWSPTRGRASYWTRSIWIFWIWNELMSRIQSQTMSTNRTASDQSEVRFVPAVTKFFDSGVNFSIFTIFLCFFLLKLLKLGGIGGVKFLTWKSGGVKFWTNLISASDKQFSNTFLSKPRLAWFKC